ncbi:MAG: tetratricopeptide repeat protein, partial [Pseudomonadota bacterium]
MARRPLSLALVTLLLSACTDPALVASLPDVPPVPLDEALPAVQTQLADLRAAVDRRPGAAKAAAALGVHYLAYQFNEAAAVALERAVRLDPDNADFGYFYAEAQVRSGKLDDAAAALEALLEHSPQDTAARRRLGQVRLELGQPEAARQALTDAVTQTPDDAYARLALGRALLDLDRPADAAGQLQAAIEIAGAFDQAHLALSQAWRALGNDAEADRELALYSRHRGQRPLIDDPRLAALLRLNLSDKALLEHAARMHAAGRVADAIRAMELAIERNPDAVSSRASLLALYAAQGREAEALAQFDAGRALDPDYAPLFYGLGVLRNRQLLPAEARRAP